MIYVFDREENFLALLDNEEKKACPYWNATVKEKLGAEYTFTFTIPYNHPDAVHVQELGYVAFLDYERNYQLFVITEVEEIHAADMQKVVMCEHISIELYDDSIEYLFVNRKNESYTLDQILVGSRWVSGIVDLQGEIHNLTVRYKSVYEALQTYQNRWNVELRFRVIIEGNKITRRYIDAFAQRGNDTGKRFEYRKDINEIRRTVLSGEVKTALYGYGADAEGQQEQTEDNAKVKIDFSSVEWSVANGDPVNKPLGQTYVGLESARLLYGYMLPNGVKRHRFGVFTVDESDPLRILQATYAKLVEVSKPIIQYAVSVIDLGSILGLESEMVRLGDRVGIIDIDLNVRLKARVIEYEFDLNNPAQSRVILGNFLPQLTQDNISDLVRSIVQENVPNVTIPDNVVTEDDIADVVRRPEIEDVVRNPDITDVVRDEDITDVVRNPDIEDVVRDEDMVDVVRNPDITDVVRDEDIIDVVRNPDIVDVVREGDITDVVRDEDITDVIREGDVILTDWLEGEIDAARNRIYAGGGTVLVTEHDGILIVDNPDNPQKAIRFLAGTFAIANERDPVTGLFNWRTFGTAEGFLSDLVETGFIRFDRSRGGTLTLGGEVIGSDGEGNPIFSNGTLSIVNSQGESIAEISGDYGGFGSLQIDELFNTQNIVYQSYANSPNLVDGVIYYYVDPYAGNDNNSGTEESPRLTVQSILDELPKYLNHDVRIRVSFGVLADTDINIEGFLGVGNLFIEKWDMPIRYVRDYIYGSTNNTSNHWTEIQMFDTNGNRLNFTERNIMTNTLLENTYVPPNEREYINGIVTGGLFTGDIRINTNQSGNANAGEIQFDTSLGSRIFHPNGKVFYEEVRADGTSPELSTRLEGSSYPIDGYIAYIGADTSRFEFPYVASSRSFMAIFWQDGGWYYDTNFDVKPFTPIADDVILARVGRTSTSANGIDIFEEYHPYASLNKRLGLIVNNVLGIGWAYYYSGATQNNLIELENPHSAKIRDVRVWHYYGDPRRYLDSRVLASPDGVKWYTVFDSEREGEYVETAEGRVHHLSRCYLKGKFFVKNCMNRVDINDIFADGTDIGDYPAVYVMYSNHVAMNNAVVFGSLSYPYSVFAYGSKMRIANTEVNDAKTAGIIAAYGATIEIQNVKGHGFPYGLYAFADAIIAGTGTGLYGDTSHTHVTRGGQVTGTFTATRGEYAPIPIVEKKATWNSNGSDAWNIGWNAWHDADNDPKQGRFDRYGPYKGLWFFGTGIRNTVMNKTIKRIRVYVTRANSSGSTNAVTIYLMPHGYANKPSSEPSLFTGNVVTVALKRGQSAWVDVTSAFRTRFENGQAYGLAIYTSSTNQAYYARMTTKAKIEVTYEDVAS